MTPKIIILSADADNLRRCVGSLVEHEPDLTAADIIVIDDGARAGEPDLPVTWLSGEVPFVFARNVNLGIQAAAPCDVILLNDDAHLMTPAGLTLLHLQTIGHEGIGAASPAITGNVCNPRQRRHWPERWRVESQMLAFVCVCIPRATIDTVGLLDEQFVHYGFDDNDYSRRILDAGLGLAVWDECIVAHDGKSSYRQQEGWEKQMAQNKALYEAKWR